MANLERLHVSQCISADYCRGWNAAVDSVVRCKDCQYYDGGECVNPNIYMSDGAHLYMSQDDFCSYGERRS